MAYQYGAPSIVGDDLFGPTSTTSEQTYDMSPPKPSFKSFVRGVAPVPFSDQPKVVPPIPAIPPPPPIPNVPTIKPRRSSSIYTTATRRASNWPKNRASSIYTTANGFNRQSTWSRKPSSTMTAGFYLQQSYSDPDLYVNPLQFEDSPRLSDISSGFSPISPDAFHWDQPDTREEQPPLLLQPTTYTPAPSPGNRSKATSSRSSVESKAPIPPQAPSIPHGLFHMTKEAMAVSPTSTGTPTPRAFAFGRDSSAYEVPLLNHERMLSKSAHVRTTSEHSAQPHLTVDTGMRRKEPGRKSAHWSAALDPAAALRSHAIESSGSSEVASEPEQPARPSMRTSRFLSQLLDMYISDWTMSPIEDLDPEESHPQETTSHARMLSEDYAAELYEQRRADQAAQEVSPSGSHMTPEPLNWKQMVASKLPTSPLSPKLPKLPKSPEAPPPPLKDAPIAPPSDAEEQLQFTSSLRSGFNTAHERTRSRSKSISSQSPSQTSSKPSSLSKKNLTNLGSRLPSKSPSPKRPRGPRPMAKAATHPKPAPAPTGLRKPDLPQPTVPSSPKLISQGLLSDAKNLLHLNRTDAPKSPILPQYDYNRPITRSPPSKDHSQQIRRALEEARRERQGGREGSADIITAIRTTGMPQEKDDPFGIYSNPGPSVPALPAFVADDQHERGRGRFHLGHIRIDSKARSKSQKRRDSIKKRIRVVGEVDPNSAIGVDIVGGAMSPAVHYPALTARSRTGTFGSPFGSPDREARERSGSGARWERPRVVPGAVGYTPIPAAYKVHDGIGPGTTHAALADNRVHQGVARMDFAPGGLEAQRTW